MKRLSLLMLILGGCSAVNVNYNVPTAHFISPEAVGTDIGEEGSTLNKIQTDFLLQPVNRISVARVYQQFLWNDYTTASDINVYQSLSLGANFNVSLLKRLDVSAKKCWDCPLMGGAKYQLVGNPENERQRGHKMAVAAYLGTFHEKEKADVATIDGRKAEKVDSDMSVFATEYHLIFGERVTETTLFYLDGFYTHHEIKTEVTREIGQKLDRSSNLDNYGGSLAAKFSTKKHEGRPEQTHFTVLGGWTQTKVFGVRKDAGNLGASLGFTW